MNKVYSSATAFRQALEARLNEMARREATDIQRLRRQFAFDRLLCRLFKDATPNWILKGGYAMELRLEESRTTRDIDLSTLGPVVGKGPLHARILDQLQEAAALAMGDFIIYAIGQPMMELAGAPHGGARYPVEARMDGRAFTRFHLDVGTGDPIQEPMEHVKGRDWLDFIGISSPAFPVITKEQQFVEKLHAYTLPRSGASNTRVRDLLDMYLLIKMGLESRRVKEVVKSIFTRRNTPELPPVLIPPPDSWANPFAALASECSVTIDHLAAYREVSDYLDGIA
jgi:predicted nucleotidyltransferase component of viral defense system